MHCIQINSVRSRAVYTLKLRVICIKEAIYIKMKASSLMAQELIERVLLKDRKTFTARISVHVVGESAYICCFCRWRDSRVSSSGCRQKSWAEGADGAVYEMVCERPRKSAYGYSHASVRALSYHTDACIKDDTYRSI